VTDLRPPVAGAHDYVPRPVPVGQQRPHAFVATPGLYASPGLLSGPQQLQQQPLYRQAAPAPGWNPWLGAGWD
jgi:hypothetical protein